MSEITFYVYDTTDAKIRLKHLCVLVEEAYKQQQTVMIYVDTEEQQSYLDDLLWTWSQNSFMPHAPVTTARADDIPRYPVVIGSTLPEDDYYTTLFNLSATVPEDYQRFQKVVEVVDGEEKNRVHLRGHYRIYRDQQQAIQTING